MSLHRVTAAAEQRTRRYRSRVPAPRVTGKGWAVLAVYELAVLVCLGGGGAWLVLAHRDRVTQNGDAATTIWIVIGALLGTLVLAAGARWYAAAVALGDRYRTPTWLRAIVMYGGGAAIAAAVLLYGSSQAWSLLPLTFLVTVATLLAMLFPTAARFSATHGDER